MIITVTITTDNAAFERVGVNIEVARILEVLAQDLRDEHRLGLETRPDERRRLRDENGNVCGEMRS